MKSPGARWQRSAGYAASIADSRLFYPQTCQPPAPREIIAAMRLSILSCMATGLILSLASAVGSELPKASPANTYPAREIHTDEKVGVAVDPCDTESKTSFMQLNYLKYGVLPMRLVITNDGGEPISLVKLKVQLVLADHAKVEPSNQEDLMRVISNTQRLGNEQDKTLPIPIPLKKKKQKEVKQLEADWSSLPFTAVAVEPHNTQAGYLFFNLGGARFKLAGAKIYVSGLKDSNGKELFYFEIPLDNYLNPSGAF